eukprot:273869-Rhodomonas_salina.1
MVTGPPFTVQERDGGIFCVAEVPLSPLLPLTRSPLTRFSPHDPHLPPCTHPTRMLAQWPVLYSRMLSSFSRSQTRSS